LLTAYYEKLSPALRQSYAPPETIAQVCMNGYDPQFMFLTAKSGGSVADRVKGLLVFSQESTLVNKPVVDDAKPSLKMEKQTKVMLHHLSAIDETVLEDFVDLGLDFIWKTMHCSAIKINLRHYM